MPPAHSTIRKLKVFLPIVLSLTLVGCFDSSRTSEVLTNRLTPEEEAITELLKPKIDFVVTRQSEASGALSDFRTLSADTKTNNTLAIDDASRRYFVAFNRLGEHLIQLGQNEPGPPILVPQTMQPLSDALAAYEGLRHTIRSIPLTDDDRRRMALAIDRVADADRALAAIWNARPLDFGSQPFSSTVTLEVTGLPLQLDITNGQVKVKYPLTIGPFKVTYLGSVGSNSGIRTLIIQNRLGRRYFAIGGKPIEVIVPRSRVTTEGSTMTIAALD
jgi:hypothetical protein